MTNVSEMSQKVEEISQKCPKNFKKCPEMSQKVQEISQKCPKKFNKCLRNVPKSLINVSEMSQKRKVSEKGTSCF